MNAGLLLLALAAPPRLVTLGAAVTETAAALGAEDSIVAVDSTSRFPASLSERPRVGYLRRLSAEGLLAHRPSRVLASVEAGPPNVMKALETHGVEVHAFPEAKNWPEAKQRIEAVGKALDRADDAKALVAAQDARLAKLKAGLPKARPRVLVLFAHGRAPMVGGRGTEADGMLALVGADNAAAALEGWKPMSEEAVLAAKPQVVVTTKEVGPAARERLLGLGIPDLKVVEMDAILLLGLGPRTADAAEQLAKLVHGP